MLHLVHSISSKSGARGVPYEYASREERRRSMSNPRMPEWLEPMAATLTQERFSGPDWLFERKFDGIRLLAYKRRDDVQLFSRNRLPQQLPDLSAAIARLPVDEAILDGEMTWDGRSYHVFDVLWLDGRDTTPLP